MIIDLDQLSPAMLLTFAMVDVATWLTQEGDLAPHLTRGTRWTLTLARLEAARREGLEA